MATLPSESIYTGTSLKSKKLPIFSNVGFSKKNGPSPMKYVTFWWA
jgi:hypothetical protein